MPAAAGWLTVTLVLIAPTALGVSLTGALTAGAAVGLAVMTRPGRRTVAATLAGACGLCAAAGAVTVLRVVAAEQSPVREIAGKTAVTVRVTGDPLYFGGPGESGGRLRLPVRIEAVAGRAVTGVPASLQAAADELPDPLPGQRLSAVVRVRPPDGGAAQRLQAARLTVAGPVRVAGAAPVWQRAAGAVRARLVRTAAVALGEREAGLLPGLVLGDTSGLDPVLREHFRAAGLTHLTAVSGANFSLVIGAVVLGLRLCGASTRVTVVLGLIAVAGFVVLVRPTDSVLRAAVMGSVGLLGALAQRRSQALPALGAAIAAIMLVWPQMALTPGFALSVVATLGLVLWAAPIRRWLTRRRLPEPLAVLVAMALAAQILTTPLIIAISDRVSLVSLPANLLVAPVVGIIGLLGTLAAVLGPLGPPTGLPSLVAELLLRAAGPEMWWLVECAQRLGSPGWAAPEVPGWQAAGVLTLAGLAGWAAWRSHVSRADSRADRS